MGRRMLKLAVALAILVLSPVIVLNGAYFLVKWATTTYRLEWAGCDGEVWWRAHAVECDGAAPPLEVELSNYWSREAASYEARISLPEEVRILDGCISVSVARGGMGIREKTISLQKDRHVGEGARYLAVLPAEFAPEEEGDALCMQFCVSVDSAATEKKWCRLVFKAKQVRHFFNIFTDIT